MVWWQEISLAKPHRGPLYTLGLVPQQPRSQPLMCDVGTLMAGELHGRLAQRRANFLAELDEKIQRARAVGKAPVRF